MDGITQTVAAVVVTHNRIEFLKKCIQSLREQTRKVEEIIVVNNNSTDGTFEWLSSQNDLSVINQENTGSAGGQHTGIKIAFEKGYDWIWCLDHDIQVEKDALEKLFSRAISSLENIGFLSSNIYFDEDNLAYLNIPELAKPYEVLNSVSKNKPIPIISASFGSLLVPHYVIKQIGLPCSEFFIYGDDAEFTLRIIENGFNGFLVRESKAKHNETSNNPNPYNNLNYKDKKFVLGIRNMTYVNIKRNIIVYNSRLRGYLSSFMFVLRILKLRRASIKECSLCLMIISFYSLFKGFLFNPKIYFPIKRSL